MSIFPSAEPVQRYWFWIQTLLVLNDSGSEIGTLCFHKGKTKPNCFSWFRTSFSYCFSWFQSPDQLFTQYDALYTGNAPYPALLYAFRGHKVCPDEQNLSWRREMNLSVLNMYRKLKWTKFQDSSASFYLATYIDFSTKISKPQLNKCNQVE